MPYSSFTKEQKWLIRITALIYLIGFVIPYKSDYVYDYDKSEFYFHVFYGWECFNFLAFFIFSAVVIVISLSPLIAIRLFVIAFLEIFMVPFLLLTMMDDNFHFDKSGLTHHIGFYLNYAGVLLAITYGFIHLRDSYPTYKRMLKDYKKDDEDVLDSF